jgi:subfamily B ATP-binding cassette protein MsbA
VLVLYYVEFQGKSMAEIFVLVIFFYKAFNYVFRFQSDWQKFNASLGGLEVIKKTARALDKNIEMSGTKIVANIDRGVELKDVNYSYDSSQVLFNINMNIPKNKSIGIVGESGAGKTTIFDILTGMLTPQSGKINIDGIDY